MVEFSSKYYLSYFQIVINFQNDPGTVQVKQEVVKKEPDENMVLDNNLVLDPTLADLALQVMEFSMNEIGIFPLLFLFFLERAHNQMITVEI